MHGTMRSMASKSTRAIPYAPRLALEWLRDRPGTRSHVVDGTLVLADITGFTPLSEKLSRSGRAGAEVLTEIVDRMFDALLRDAYAFGAELLFFGGDALLLLFRGPHHSERAALGAIGIRRSTRDLSRDETAVGRINLRVSIGVHSGDIDLFLVGQSWRQLIASGPAVSAVVDAERTAGSGQIVLSSSAGTALPSGVLRSLPGGSALLRSAPPGVERSMLPKPLVGVGNVAPLLLSAAVRDPVVSGTATPEHRDATVAFIKVWGTDRSAGRELEVADQLHAVVCRLDEACEMFGVTHLGADVDLDAVKLIVVAGVPLSRGDDEERLLLAVRHLLDAESPLPLSAGLHRGNVFAGPVGPSYRRTFTVMGDTVNLAARLMNHSEPGQLLATRAVVERSRSAFETTPIAPFVAKGKRRPVEAMDVVGRDDDQIVAQESAAQLVGRRSEMAVLEAVLVEAHEQGQVQHVEVVGEPGMGKSTLAQSFAAAHPSLRCITVRGDLYTITTPYRAMKRLLKEVCRLPDDVPSARRILDDLCAREVPESAGSLALLNPILNADWPETPATHGLTEDAMRRRRARLVSEIVAKVLPPEALLVMEDVHWFDEPSLHWLGTLVEEPLPLGWVVLRTRRPPDEEDLPPAQSDVQRIVVSALGADAVNEIMKSEHGGKPLPPAAARDLARRASGNPFYLRELVRAFATSGGIEELPDSLEALLTARLDRLERSDRALVCRAAVLGERFAVDDLDSVFEDDALVPSSDVLSRVSDFIRLEEGRQLAFQHALMRESAYEHLPFRLRARLHGKVADDVLQRRPADLPVLSYHYMAAGRWPEAWRASRAAGEAALVTNAPVEAATLLRRALDASRHVDQIGAEETLAVGLQMNLALERNGSFERADRSYRSLARFAETPIDRARLKVQHAWLAERQSRISLAIRRSRAAQRELALESHPDRDALSVLAAAKTAEGMALEVAGKHHRAAVALEEATTLARRANDRRAEADAGLILDWCLLKAGRGGPPEHLQKALALYEELDDLPRQASCLTNLGALAYMDGRWPEAIEFYRRGQAAHVRSGDETTAAIDLVNIGEVLSDQGHWREAIECLSAAQETWIATGHTHGVAYSLGLLGRTQARLQEFDQALESLTTAREQHRAVGAKEDAAQAWLWLAEAHWLAGDGTHARHVLADGANDGSVTARRVEVLASLAERSKSEVCGRLTDLWRRADQEGEHYEQVALAQSMERHVPDLASDEIRQSRDIAGRLGIVRVAEPD